MHDTFVHVSFIGANSTTSPDIADGNHNHSKTQTVTIFVIPHFPVLHFHALLNKPLVHRVVGGRHPLQEGLVWSWRTS